MGFSKWRNPLVVSSPLLLFTAAAFLPAPRARAQVVTDGTLGHGGALTGPAFTIPATMGQTRGPNLFHSFEQFNLSHGQSASFTGPGSINNILSRVTGGRPSSLDGLLTSTIPGVNFFFLNPNGVLFGPHAQVRVGGAFVATTADVVRLRGGGTFQARQPSASVLTSAPPAAFGFLSSRPAAIRLNDSQLQVGHDRTLALVGGDLAMNSGSLSAPGGAVNLVSAGSAGEVAWSGAAPASQETLPGFSRLGSISVRDGATVSADNGGQVLVRGGSMLLDNARVAVSNSDHSTGGAIDIGLQGGLKLSRGADVEARNFGTGRGAGIRVRAGTVSLDGGSGIGTKVFAAGAGGDVGVTTTKKLSIRSGSRVYASTYGNGTGGSINIEADNTSLDGQGSSQATGILAQTHSTTNGGHGGDISIQTQSLDVLREAQVDASTFGNGAAGNISVKADDIRLDGQDSSYFTGIAAQTQSTTNGGHGGDIKVQTQDLTVLNGAAVDAVTFGSGAAGNINIKADNISLDGQGSSQATGIAAETHGATDGGHGGDIKVDTKNLTVLSGAEVSAATLASGEGGSIHIKADTIRLDGQGSGVFTGIGAQTQGSGQGGDLVVKTKGLEVLDGAAVDASTFSSGAGGNVTIRADHIRLNGQGDINTGIGAQTQGASHGGQGGDISVDTKDLTILNGAAVAASSFGSGAGGSINVKADNVDLDGKGNTTGTGTTGTGIFAATRDLGPGGQGGAINLDIGTLNATNGAVISAETDGSGRGGNISITASAITLSHTGQVESSSKGSGNAGVLSLHTTGNLTLNSGAAILTSATHSNGGDVTVSAGDGIHLDNSRISAQAGGDGGGVTLRAGNMIFLRDSELSARAGGSGGNISIDPRFVILNRSRITADAIRGNGGNINIRSQVFLPSIESRISASSQFGVAGSILVQSPNTGVGGSLVRLQTRPLGAENYLAERCVVRQSGQASSFTVGGSGGVPPQPDAPLPSVDVAGK